MSLISTRKPRPFQHNFIYVDERKERLKEIEERAKRELEGEKSSDFNPERLRGTFTDAARSHGKRRKNANRQASMNIFLTVLLIVALTFLWIYLTK